MRGEGVFVENSYIKYRKDGRLITISLNISFFLLDKATIRSLLCVLFIFFICSPNCFLSKNCMTFCSLKELNKIASNNQTKQIIVFSFVVCSFGSKAPCSNPIKLIQSLAFTLCIYESKTTYIVFREKLFLFIRNWTWKCSRQPSFFVFSQQENFLIFASHDKKHVK